MVTSMMIVWKMIRFGGGGVVVIEVVLVELVLVVIVMVVVMMNIISKFMTTTTMRVKISTLMIVLPKPTTNMSSRTLLSAPSMISAKSFERCESSMTLTCVDLYCTSSSWSFTRTCGMAEES